MSSGKAHRILITVKYMVSSSIVILTWLHGYVLNNRKTEKEPPCIQRSFNHWVFKTKKLSSIKGGWQGA